MRRAGEVSKKLIPIIYGFSVLFLAAIIVHMYSAADARFVPNYGTLKLLAFTTIILATLIGIRRSNKALIALTVLIFIADAVVSRIAFKGSLERFLYSKNERMYQQAVTEIMNKGLTRYVRFEGDMRKLYISYVYVQRLGDDMTVSFSMGRPGVRSKIIFAGNKRTLQYFYGEPPHKFIALDKQWWIVRPD